MTKEKIWKRIIIYEIIGFLFIIVIIWCNEIFDLPHHIFNAEKTPINIVESSVESFFVLLLSLIIIKFTINFLKRIQYLEGFLLVCAYCKKIKIREKWVPIDVYIQNHSAVKFSHGLCPECVKEHYGELL